MSSQFLNDLRAVCIAELSHVDRMESTLFQSHAIEDGKRHLESLYYAYESCTPEELNLSRSIESIIEECSQMLEEQDSELYDEDYYLKFEE